MRANGVFEATSRGGKQPVDRSVTGIDYLREAENERLVHGVFLGMFRSWFRSRDGFLHRMSKFRLIFIEFPNAIKCHFQEP